MIKQYLGHLIWSIYVTDLKYIWLVMGTLIILWIIFGFIGMKKFPCAWRTLNKIGFICSVAAVIYLTVANRSADYRVSPDFIPFHFVIEAKEQVEMWRTALMNVFLFLPLGLTMPFAIKKKSIAYSLIFAVIFSVLIECSQYFFMLGQAEIDDVLCNVFGAILGIIPFLISGKSKKMRNQKLTNKEL